MRVSQLGRALAAMGTLGLLLSCGGGGSDGDARRSGAQEERRHAQAFVPPVAIPLDANVNGMWSPVYPWPIIAVHSVLLPDGRLLTYASATSGLQTANANVEVWDSSG